MNKKKMILAIVIFVIDQILKSIVQLNNVNITVIDNFFRLTYYQNTGAAWSILEGHGYMLIFISLIMLVLVFNMMYSYEDDKLNNTAFGLLVGGILGNLSDRVFYGMVRDFVDICIFGYEFPVFNIADMAIVIGVLLILISTIKGDLKNGNRSKRKRVKNR
ncbi:MAG: signal peptidase II [Bacilli bacterium]|nr:signal peptidase II [Bacilli bacterium]